jgi:hypothetical protein
MFWLVLFFDASLLFFIPKSHHTNQTKQHTPTQPTRTGSTSSKTAPSIVHALLYNPLTHLPLSLHFIKYKQTYTLISKSPSNSHNTHTHNLPKSTAFQVKHTHTQNYQTMAASDFSATGAPVNSFTEYRGYRPKMGCVLQSRGQLYMSSCTLQGRGQLYMSSCTLQGRGQLYMSSCSLMRN